MLTKLYLNGSQLAHGNGLTEVLELLAMDGTAIDPATVKELHDGSEAVVDETGLWRVVEEPAMTSKMVQFACESGESFVMVLCGMEGRFGRVE